MTEEDTFKALRRKSFNEVLIAARIVYNVNLGKGARLAAQKFVEESGWDYIEFQDKLREHNANRRRHI